MPTRMWILGTFPESHHLFCVVSSIKYMADTETDEVYAKIRLVPLRGNECSDDNTDDGGLLAFDKDEGQEKPNSFA